MKVSIGIGGAASGRKHDFDEQVDYARERFQPRQLHRRPAAHMERTVGVNF
jgi:hypothetical protein